MGRVPDRRKLRWEYLKHKGKLRTMETFAIAIFFPSFCAALVLGMVVISVAILAVMGESWGWAMFIISALLLAFSICFIRWSWKIMDRVDRQFKELQYVPPVSAATLPVEEILVRAADAPATTDGDELLRSVRAQETSHDELVRVVQMD